MLGAGEGWAKSILFNARARDEFEAFFQRGDTFALGVCNGCQMMSNLRESSRAREHWPHFVRNRSEQFEARFVMVEVQALAVAVLRGHGRAAACRSRSRTAKATRSSRTRRSWQQRAAGGAALRRQPRQRDRDSIRYNPNGSPQGITGLTTPDGRFTILMPHPERVFRTVQNSWHPEDWGEDGPWMRMFRNARRWVG